MVTMIKREHEDEKPKLPEQWLAAHPVSRYWEPKGTHYAKDGAEAGLKPSPYDAAFEHLEACDYVTRYGANLLVMPLPLKMRVSQQRALSDANYFADPSLVTKKGVVESFMHPDLHRVPEPPRVTKFLVKDLGLAYYGRFPYPCEGFSCVKVSPGGEFVIVCHGVRVDQRVLEQVRELYDGLPVIGVKIVQPAIHTDCVFACLWAAKKVILVNRHAFAPACEGWDPERTWNEIRVRANSEGTDLVELLASDGYNYGTNVMQLFSDTNAKHSRQRADRFVRVLAPTGMSDTYVWQLRQYGYAYHPISMLNLFNLGGGAPACEFLDLTSAWMAGWRLPSKGRRFLYKSVRPALVRLYKTYPKYVV